MRDGRFRFKSPGRYGLIILILLVGVFLLLWEVGKNSAESTVAPTVTPDNIVTRIVVEAAQDENCNEGSAVPVEVQAQSLEGERPLAEYTLSDTVPDAATTSSAGFEIDLGINCKGTVDIILDSITYLESDQTNNSVPNGMFDSGLTGWHSWPIGSDSFSLIASPTNTGQAIKVNVGENENFGISSDSFEVTPGSKFTITFLANISPTSVGRGSFNITFRGNFQPAHGVVQFIPFEAR